MMTQGEMAVETMQEFQMIPLERLRPSKTNPRRHGNPAAFEELKRSIKARGVLVPLLVRPLPEDGQFEIVAGERRYKAAKQGGIKEVPVRMQPMTDAEALEIQVIENLQREDVHPVDEGSGYRVLMDKAGHGVQAIAEKVGKSASYVYQRLKLAELIEPAKKACLDDKITAGHAILIARLQPKDQFATLEALRAEEQFDPMSVRDLADWIEREIHLDLRAAPFATADARLVPAAGACTTCPKRTGFVPDLYPDIRKKDTCTDRICYQGKVGAFLAQRKAEIKAKDVRILELSGDYTGPRTKDGPLPHSYWEEVKKGSCKSATAGLVVNGRDTGKVVMVCTDPACKTHVGHHYRPYQASPAEKARQKRQAEKSRTEQRARARILDAVMAKAPARLQSEDLRLVARAVYSRWWHDSQKMICARRQWYPRKGPYGQKDYQAPAVAAIARMTDAELGRFLVELALVGEVPVSQWRQRPPALLLAAAKRHKINVAKVRREAAAQATQRAPAKKRVQTSAQKGKGKRRAG